MGELTKLKVAFAGLALVCLFFMGVSVWSVMKLEKIGYVVADLVKRVGTSDNTTLTPYSDNETHIPWKTGKVY